MDATALNLLHGNHFVEFEGDGTFARTIAGVRWVRSYWQPGAAWGVCHYAGPDPGSVERWNDICGIPYLEVSEVEVVEGKAAADYPRGFHAPPESAPLIVVEAASRSRCEVSLPALRTYRYLTTGDELRFYLAADRDGGIGRRVVEFRPEDYE